MLQAYHQPILVEAGIDEAGRGCYAGPVFAAAVILPNHFHHPLLNDSKQVKEHHRNELRIFIEANAIAYGVGIVDETIIDEINILQATYKAMHLAIAQLTTVPQLLLIDGNRFKPYPQIPHQCMVKGDATYMHIAAASILAKTHRDEHMQKLHAQFPQYDWVHNKGYGTASHRKAIEQFGICPHHRKSFNILPQQLP
jgi:ribonuclease HII